MICWRSMEFIPSEKQIVIHSNSLKHNPQNISQLVFERNDFIKRWIPYTFFIYLFHIPALSIVKKVMLLVGRGEEWSYWITFLVSPFIMAAVAIWIGGVLKNIYQSYIPF